MNVVITWFILRGFSHELRYEINTSFRRLPISLERFRSFRPPVHSPWCEIRCRRRHRHRPAPHSVRNARWFRPVFIHTLFLSVALPSSLQALRSPSSSWNRVHHREAAGPQRLRWSISSLLSIFQLAYCAHLLTYFLSHAACPSSKGDVEGDLSGRLDPHRFNHTGGVSQLCRRTQPDARVSDIFNSS